MSEKMIAYIQSQPHVWHTAAGALPGALRTALGAMNGGETPRRVVMVGSGSSHYACRAVCALAAGGACEFFSAVPTRMGPFLPLRPGTVWWAVSQSGKSTSTLRAVRALREAGGEVWTFTADPASPLAQCGDGHVCIPCGDETVGPKTKGVSTTILTLWLAAHALAAGAPPEEGLHPLAPAFGAAQENLRLCRTWAENCTDALLRAPCLTLVAEGPALPLAEEGALKLLETLYVPAQAWEFEEYLHGVNNIIGPGQVHLFVLRGGERRARMERLIEYCAGRGAVCLCIDCAAARPCVDGLRLALRCTGEPQALAFELLPAFQMLSAVVSAAKGIECDRPRYPDFYAALDTKAGAQR